MKPAFVISGLLVALAAAPAQASLPEPGELPKVWITGGSNCIEVPGWRIHEYSPTPYVLRESGCTNYEKPCSSGVTAPTRLLQTAVALVAGGSGIALATESFRDNLKIRGVVYRPIQEETPLAELVAIWRRDNNSPLLATFRRELEAVLRRAIP